MARRGETSAALLVLVSSALLLMSLLTLSACRLAGGCATAGTSNPLQISAALR